MTDSKLTERDHVPCPRGDGGRTVKSGRQRGRQRYLCKLCGRRFSDPRLFRPGGRFPNVQVGSALQWYFDGLSYRDVSLKVAEVFKTKPPDRSTVFNWVQLYSRAAAEALRDHRADTGGVRLVAGEYVKINGRHFRLWNVIDLDSHYLLISYLTEEWSEHVTAEVMERAEGAAVNLPESIVVDRSDQPIWPLHKDDTRLDRYLVGDYIRSNIHYFLSSGSSRWPYGALRTMKTFPTAQTFLDGWRIDYNLFRPQDELDGRTPASAVGMEVPFSSWEGVVRVAESIPADKSTSDRPTLPWRPRRELAMRDSSRLPMARSDGC